MEVFTEIENFAKFEESGGALLLTGEWGCGKTYLVNKLRSKLDPTKYYVVCLSLFGISSVDQLSTAIKQKMFFSLCDVDDSNQKIVTRLFRAIRKTASLIQEHVDKVKIANTILSINLFDYIHISSTDYYGRKLILVFDDFERCDIPCKELLGAINEYTETRKIKTIIVADESKISDSIYEDFKEKVIAETIRYIPEYETAIRDIVDQYHETEPGYSSFLTSQIPQIGLLREESQCGNLRTVLSLLIRFERIFACIKKNGFDIDEKICGSLLYSFGAMFFEMTTKKGKESHEMYSDPDVPSDMDKKYSRFNEQGSAFISFRNLIAEGIWREDYFIQEYAHHFSSSILGDDHKLLSWSIWDCDDEIVKNGLSILIPKGYAGELPCCSLLQLLPIIGMLRKHGVSIPIPIDYALLEKGLHLRGERIKSGELVEPDIPEELFESQWAVLNDEEEKLCKLARRIADDYSHYWANRTIFIQTVTSGCVEDIRKLQSKHYISLDMEMASALLSRYWQADNRIKRVLAMLISRIDVTDYRRSERETRAVSLESMREIQKRIETYDTGKVDGITKVINSLFIQELSKKISIIEQYLNADTSSRQ